MKEMKNLVLYSFFTIIIAWCCAGCAKNVTTIEGNIGSEWNGKTIYLQLISEEKMIPEIVDSTIIQEGRFLFEQQAREPQTALLSIVDQNKAVWTSQFILEKGNIKIIGNEQGNAQISGTPNNELVQEYLNRWYVPFNKMRQISNEVSRLEKAGQLTSALYDSLDRISSGYMREMRLLALEFVKENINTPAGRSQVMEIVGLPERLLVEIPEKADSVSLHHPLVQKIVKRVNTYNAVAIGKTYQDAVVFDTQNQEVHLSDYIGKGKYVLIDFWASWCKPCCAEMPELKRLYDQYKQQGFEIVGISVEQDKDSWKAKIEELRMDWPQLLDVKEEAARKYVVGTIPHTVLIDPSGVIIAKNLRGKELGEKIAQSIKGNN